MTGTAAPAPSQRRGGPLLDPDPAGGQVVVTRFSCRTVPRMLLVLALHARLKRAVRRQATGFCDIKTLVSWPTRTILSISLWRDLDSIYSMGEVPQHVMAARVPVRFGIRTSCGIYCFVGGWQRVMFRTITPDA